ncbi:MAG: DNA cytosine methyltransferase [Candidatus Onthomorpha sp.]
MTHGSLFSGIGGFDLGAERAGFQNLWACEIDEFKQAVLRKHFPDTQIYSDIKTINPPYVDVISGGFPCQDISSMQMKFKNNRYGNYGIKGERSGLWSEYARVIRHVRPKYVIIENSPMLPVRGLEVVLCDLAAAGYDAEWQTLSAKAFGFPHLRKRCFVVAYSMQGRRNRNNRYFTNLDKLFQSEPPEEITVPVSPTRDFPQRDDKYIRENNGLLRRLYRHRIAACGDAVIPTITEYLFRALIEFDKQR